MMISFASAAWQHRMWGWWQTEAAPFSDFEDIFMKWETPQAVDFRFGMEITMYIANR
jgi:coenzyme PQQ precursor peptide PqqA